MYDECFIEIRVYGRIPPASAAFFGWADTEATKEFPPLERF
jgi:hypothetical protein